MNVLVELERPVEYTCKALGLMSSLTQCLRISGDSIWRPANSVRKFCCVEPLGCLKARPSELAYD